MRYSFMIGALAACVHAHTWIEQLNVIASNGTLVGDPGFPRGNVKRGTPGFGDPAMVNLIPPNSRPINQILTTDLMCKDTQAKQQQGNGARLKAPAGANVALRYQENGHVSLPDNQPGKPSNRGTVFVYGTTDPREDDKFLSIHRVWNAEGTGGDRRGVLLSTQNYDDGQCYQINGGKISTQRQKTFVHVANSLMGADLWCQQDVQVPTNAPSGKPYTLYWVWDWPTMPGTAGFPEGKQEIYTTCMDIDIQPAANVQQKAIGVSFVKQDFGSAAVASQLADIANPTAVVAQFIPFSGVPNGPSASSSASSAAASKLPSSTVQSGKQTSIPVTSQSIQAALPPYSATPHIVDSTVSMVVTNTPPAPSSTDQNGRPSQTRPVVSPVGTMSPPYPQSSNGVRPSGQSVPSGSVASGAAQNTGTAISRPGQVTATISAVQAVSTVYEMTTEIKTVVKTKLETIYQSNPLTSPAAVGTSRAKRAEPTSTTESAYLLRARNFFHPRQ